MEIPNDCTSCVFWLPMGDTCHPSMGEFRKKNVKCEFYKLSPSYGGEGTQTSLDL